MKKLLLLCVLVGALLCGSGSVAHGVTLTRGTPGLVSYTTMRPLSRPFWIWRVERINVRGYAEVVATSLNPRGWSVRRAGIMACQVRAPFTARPSGKGQYIVVVKAAGSGGWLGKVGAFYLI